MNSKSPLVSIGLPVYNGEKFLSRAIDSILRQDFDDFELLISDNFSTDSTPDICDKYARQDSRVKYSRLGKNMGAAYNYNRVFLQSSGKFFKWSAHDDVILPTFISRCIEVFESHAKSEVFPSIVYPKSNVIDENDEVITLDPNIMFADSSHPAVRVYRAVQTMGLAAPIFGLMPRRMVERTRLIGSFVASDYVFMLEAAMLGSIIQFDDVLFLRRIHPDGSRVANRKMKDLLAWFDPQARSRLSENQKLILEYYRSIFVLEGLNLSDRFACLLGLTLGVSKRGLRQTRVSLGYYRRKMSN